MPDLILYMAMSVDGFIAGPNDGPNNPAGDGGMRLMHWLGDGRGDITAGYRPDDRQSRIVFDECKSTGAVITGRRTGDFARYWGGDHHDGVPMFVPTHRAPEVNPHPLVHYVTDGIESCVAQAKAAAGDRDVMLHGATTAQACLEAGLLDVLEIQLMPVLLGQGRLLFEHLAEQQTELALVRTLEAPGVLHLRYVVRH